MHLNLSTEELGAWVRLSLEPGLGPAQARSLLAAIGLPQDIYAMSTAGLGKFLPGDLARQLKQAPSDEMQEAIHNTLQWLEYPSHHLLTLADPAYPRALLDTHDPPILLYANGNLGLLSRPIISIVGARSATAGGTDNARAFARYLAEQGWCIASGLALGIDTAAHEGALLAGPNGASTIAILGTGIDIVYPARNRELAHRIAQDGILISEFPLGTRALPYQFPKRNRLVAGVARGVLVVEAAKQSGSLITARLASEIGREVFAIPGSIHSPLSRGCHALIRQGAKLVESGKDILEELGSAPVESPTPGPGKGTARKQPAADPSGLLVLEALGYDPVHLDALQERSGLDIATLTARLLEFELQEVVARLDDGRFQRR
ncbi:DNA-processing protein DprA [Pollutimonas bauzanensis]|uniref:DNA-processing protein DprA n=1 Tax=Pollutimonas bauzanensis TaxID=658167 RepID=UPI0033407125